MNMEFNLLFRESGWSNGDVYDLSDAFCWLYREPGHSHDDFDDMHSEFNLLFRESGWSHIDFDDISYDLRWLFRLPDDFHVDVNNMDTNLDGSNEGNSSLTDSSGLSGWSPGDIEESEDNLRDLAMAALFGGISLEIPGFSRPIDTDKLDSVKRQLQYDE